MPDWIMSPLLLDSKKVASFNKRWNLFQGENKEGRLNGTHNAYTLFKATLATVTFAGHRA